MPSFLVLLSICFLRLSSGDGITEAPFYPRTGKLSQFLGFVTPRPLPQDANFVYASVWASWSAWSYCINNVRIRVRACNTVKGFSCFGKNQEQTECELKKEQLLPAGTDYDVADPWEADRKEALRQLYSRQEATDQKLKITEGDIASENERDPVDGDAEGTRARNQERFESAINQNQDIISSATELEQIKPLNQEVLVPSGPNKVYRLFSTPNLNGNSRTKAQAYVSHVISAKIESHRNKINLPELEKDNSFKDISRPKVGPNLPPIKNEIKRTSTSLLSKAPVEVSRTTKTFWKHFGLFSTTTASIYPGATPKLQRKEIERQPEPSFKYENIEEPEVKNQDPGSSSYIKPKNDNLFLIPSVIDEKSFRKIGSSATPNKKKQRNQTKATKKYSNTIKKQEEVITTAFPKNDLDKNDKTARIIWHKPMIKKIGPLSILGTDKPTTEISRINISPKKSSLHSGEVTPSQKKISDDDTKNALKLLLAKMSKVTSEMQENKFNDNVGNNKIQILPKSVIHYGEIEASQRKNEGFTGENNGRTIKNRIFARKSGENASKPQKIFSSSLYSWKRSMHNNSDLLAADQVEKEIESLESIDHGIESLRSMVEIIADNRDAPERERTKAVEKAFNLNLVPLGPLTPAYISTPPTVIDPSFLRVFGARTFTAARWSEWSNWGECFCGKMVRTRTCHYDDPYLTDGCIGKSYESLQCDDFSKCPTTAQQSQSRNRLFHTLPDANGRLQAHYAFKPRGISSAIEMPKANKFITRRAYQIGNGRPNVNEEKNFNVNSD